MGIFTNTPNNHTPNLANKYGLNALDTKELEHLQKIEDSYNNMKALDLKQTHSSDRATVNLLNILVNQNWLILKQLSEINSKK